jgi:hypothetical protein
VDVAGGYVVTAKADQATHEKDNERDEGTGDARGPQGQRGPLRGVLAAFDDLCARVRDRASEEERRELDARLRKGFEGNFEVLRRLLPQVDALSPDDAPAQQQLDGATAASATGGEQMNFHNVCFVLQRFMRVMSSTRHPVV